MFCKKCGKEIDDDLKSCPYCMADLSEENNMQGKLVLDKKKVTVVISIIVVIAALAAIAVISFVVGRKTADNGNVNTNTTKISETSVNNEKTTETAAEKTTETTKSESSSENKKPSVETYLNTDIPNYGKIFGVSEEIVPTDTVIFKHYTSEADYMKYLKILEQCGFYLSEKLAVGDVYQTDQDYVTVSSGYDDNGKYYVLVGSDFMWDYFNAVYR